MEKRTRVSGLEEFFEFLAHSDSRFVRTLDGMYELVIAGNYLTIKFVKWSRPSRAQPEKYIYDMEKKQIIYYKGRFTK